MIVVGKQETDRLAMVDQTTPTLSPQPPSSSHISIMEQPESWSGWAPDTYNLLSPPCLEATMGMTQENDFPRLAKWCVAYSTRPA